MEHILHSHIMKRLERHGILVDSQHGFRSGSSTEMQFVYTFHDIAKAWMRIHLYHWPFLVFSKPFDKFPLLRLLQKLQFYGIRGPISLWSKSFFTERYQRGRWNLTQRNVILCASHLCGNDRRKILLLWQIS